ncbi:spore coat protein [Staphylococcus pseudintermedius]
MRILRQSKPFKYVVLNKLNEYQLLRDFSPNTIKFNLAYLNMQINEMHHLSTGHTCKTSMGLVPVSCNVEKLAIWIIEQKQALERYKKRANKNMAILRRCMQNYSLEEQKEIKYYLSSNGRYGNKDVIERLRCDLYQHINDERMKRNKAREDERLINRYKQARQLLQVTTA